MCNQLQTYLARGSGLDSVPPGSKKLTFVYPYTHFENLVGSERKNSFSPTGTLVR